MRKHLSIRMQCLTTTNIAKKNGVYNFKYSYSIKHQY